MPEWASADLNALIAYGEELYEQGDRPHAQLVNSAASNLAFCRRVIIRLLEAAEDT